MSYKKLFFLSSATLLLLVSCQESLNFENELYRFSTTQLEASELIIDKDDVLKIIEPISCKYPDRWVDVSENIIPAQTTIEYNAFGVKTEETSKTTIVSPKYDSWLAVIGPDFTINGPQKQLHFFINIETGEYFEILLDGRAVVEWDDSRNIYDYSNADYSQLLPKILPNSPSRSSSRWAVILSGGVDKFHNCERYWNDCQYAYLALTQQLNYPSSHILCLVADGQNPEADRKIGENIYDSSPIDFDNDGYIDIGYAATKSNLSSVFNYLSTVVSPGDEVLVFITDHGGRGGIIYLWGQESLTPSELDAEIDKLGSSVTIDIVMGQCYSGACIPALIANNRTISTAASENQTSSGSSLNGYDFFLKYWVDAICYINPNMTSSYSNGDGHLSLYEQFKYAKAYTEAITPDLPTYHSSPDILFWGHDLTGNNFTPYINGDEYISTLTTKIYTLNNLSSQYNPTWSCSSNLSIYSSNSSSATIKGNLQPSQYVSLGASVSISFSDLGRTWTATKNIASVWKPGTYTGYNHITGNNGSYYLRNIPASGIYPGTSGYHWTSHNSYWQITSQNGGFVQLTHPSNSGPATLSLVFTDPFGSGIYISDQVY